MRIFWHQGGLHVHPESKREAMKVEKEKFDAAPCEITPSEAGASQEDKDSGQARP